MQFINSQQGKKLLQLNGFLYRKEKIHKDVEYWRCVDKTCKGRLSVKNELIIKHPTDHNHVPDVNVIEAKKIVETIKNRVVVAQDNPGVIIAESSASVKPVVFSALPQIEYLKRTIQRTRQQNSLAPPNPSNLDQLQQLPNEYKLTSNGKLFLLFDSFDNFGVSNNRVIIFCTQDSLDLMSKSEHWFADGTFKTAPLIFSQIYTIHVLKNGICIPTLYALLPDKKFHTYVRILEILKEKKPSLNPKSILTDFEHASINAFKEVFPHIDNRGCFFHLSQCIWRKLQSITSMQDKYINDVDFCVQVRLLPALAFVPITDVVKAFETLIDSEYYVQHEEFLQPLVDYFEDTWIGRPCRRQGRRSPAFSIPMWNCYEATNNELPKTNNSIEGWNRGFSCLLGSCNPTIWKCIKALQKQQTLVDIKMVQMISGSHSTTTKKKYKDSAKTLKTVINNYNTMSILEYLKGIAYNFSLQV